MTIATWWPALMTLGAGLAAGLAYTFATRKEKPFEADAEGDAADAQRRKDLLVGQLRELAEERHKLPDDHYQSERRRLEEEAARALRAREEAAAQLARQQGRANEGPQAVGLAGWLAARPQARGALWGGGIVAAFVFAGWFVFGEKAPPPMEASPAARQSAGVGPGDRVHDPELQAAIIAVRTNPESVAALNRLGHLLLSRQAFSLAEEVTERALRLDALDPEARTHRAAIRSIKGEDEKALEELRELAAHHPDANEAFLYRGLVALRTNDRLLAIESLERYLQRADPGPETEEIRSMVRELKAGQEKAP